MASAWHFMDINFLLTAQCYGLKCIPPEDVEVLVPSAYEYDLIWK